MTIGEIKYINKEIQRLNSKLARLESEVYSTTPKLDDLPSGSGVSDKVGNLVSQITDIKLDIQAVYWFAAAVLNAAVTFKKSSARRRTA